MLGHLPRMINVGSPSEVLTTTRLQMPSLALTGSDPNDAREFQVAIARKLGLPIDILLPYVYSTVRANENSYRTIVDPYGNGVASATGVPGDHVRRFHDRIVVSLARAAGIYAKGGHTGTCKGIFRKCMGDYHLNEDGQRLLQGIVPDGFLDAQGRVDPANPL